MVIFLMLFSILFNFSTILPKDIHKAVRPDTFLTSDFNFPASCSGCCDNQDSEDCRLVNIESLIVDLASCSCCQFSITQADIGSGDTYIITQPGIYCLAEDVTFSTDGFAIQINTTLPEVTLDLGGHTITGTGTGAAVLVRNVPNVAVIQNGAITSGGNSIEIDNSSRITIRNIDITTPGLHGISIYNQSGGVFINDVTVLNAALDGIRVTDSSGIFINNVISATSLFDGIHIVNSTIVGISSSKVIGNAGSGLYIDGVIECNCENVFSFANGIYGFIIESVTGPSLVVTYTDCNTGANQQGGFIVTNGPSMLSGVIKYIRCLSSNFSNSGDGFALINNGGDIDSIEYIECTSLTAQNGFSTGIGTSGSIPKHIVYDSCIAQDNLGDGFFIDCTGVILRYCIAEKNNGNGITLNPNSINCQVLSCTASENGNIGITDTGTTNLVHANTALGNSVNYNSFVPLTLKPTDITGHWINVDPTSSTIGEYESKIDALSLLTESCCQLVNSKLDVIITFLGA